MDEAAPQPLRQFAAQRQRDWRVLRRAFYQGLQALVPAGGGGGGLWAEAAATPLIIHDVGAALMVHLDPVTGDVRRVSVRHLPAPHGPGFGPGPLDPTRLMGHPPSAATAVYELSVLIAVALLGPAALLPPPHSAGMHGAVVASLRGWPSSDAAFDLAQVLLCSMAHVDPDMRPLPQQLMWLLQESHPD